MRSPRAARGLWPAIWRAGAPASSRAFRGRSPGRTATSSSTAAAIGYLFHRHKFTWLTERAVEVPVAQALVDEHAADRVLEIGNVLSHYRPQQHVVVDKYEQAPGVLNRDVLDLGGLGQFELIVAISTLEHVGWDESPRDPAKAQRAVEVLRSLLAPGGSLAITVPVGYNTAFDAALRSGEVPLHRAVALRRAGGTRWRRGHAGRRVVGAVRLPALSRSRGAVRIHRGPGGLTSRAARW